MEYLYLIWAQLFAITIFLYLYVRHKYSHWSNLGVAGPRPSLLTFGNVYQIVSRNPLDVELELARKYGKVYGNYFLLEPTLTISDPELIRQILIKDFSKFCNRRQLRTQHEIFNNMQFFIEINDWKRLRMITSKTFSSGKLRGMLPLMDECIDKLMVHFDWLIESSHHQGVFNTEGIMAGLTTDVIASTAFGTETDVNESHRTGKRQNPLLFHGKNLLEINPLKAVSVLTMPKWFNKLIGFNMILNTRSFDFFSDLSREMLCQRRNRAMKRNDLLQALIDASVDDNELANKSFKKLAVNLKNSDNVSCPSNAIKTDSRQIKLADNEIIAQCILFFVAGFETTAYTFAYCLFELAQHPDIQLELVERIAEAFHDLEIDSQQYYDTLMNEIPLLDAVIKETLRKYPLATRLERRLMTDEIYDMGGIPVRKGQLVEVAVLALHYNPEYFPEPDRFLPGRFMGANGVSIAPYTYLPFGLGPRNCIGMRFAYQEIKLCLAKLLLRYRFIPTAQTPIKLTFLPFKPGLFSVPFLLKVERRI